MINPGQLPHVKEEEQGVASQGDWLSDDSPCGISISSIQDVSSPQQGFTRVTIKIMITKTETSFIIGLS